MGDVGRNTARGFYVVEVPNRDGSAEWVREFEAIGDDFAEKGPRSTFRADRLDDCERYMRGYGRHYRIVVVREVTIGEYNMQRPAARDTSRDMVLANA